MEYAKLRGKIREKYKRQEDFAIAMGMNPTTLSKKLNAVVDWTRKEIEKACDLLEIPYEEIHIYFFTL